ncbi:MAG: hypothetical protein MZV64_13290 [Ignavibacteriales bacterium]|nr:hypothetical protein [Ignavibacteriales bacterium]
MRLVDGGVLVYPAEGQGVHRERGRFARHRYREPARGRDAESWTNSSSAPSRS